METFSLFFVCGGPLLRKTLQHKLCIGCIWMVYWENLQQSIDCINIYLLFQIICFKLYRLIRQSCLLALFWKLSIEIDERLRERNKVWKLIFLILHQPVWWRNILLSLKMETFKLNFDYEWHDWKWFDWSEDSDDWLTRTIL